MKRILVFIVVWGMVWSVVGPAYANGHKVAPELWIRAVINTQEKGQIEAVWKHGGQGFTPGGDQVIWGHFYASPNDVNWGSQQNPDLFVKIWFDRGGRIDVNFFHVSVPDITVYSDYPYDGVPDEQGVTTMVRRYVRQYYEKGQSGMDVTYEDGQSPAEYVPEGSPSGYDTAKSLRIGAIINTIEKDGIEGVWQKGGEDTTEDGHEVVWGYFHASPDDVNWGSKNNPDLFTKIWFDNSGRVDVNFFHVSVPDIEAYSVLPDNGTYDQKGTTTLDDRYVRHEYQIDFELKRFVLTSETPAADCEEPVSDTVFTASADKVTAWIKYRNSEPNAFYRLEWESPEGEIVRTYTGPIGVGHGCSWYPLSMETLRKYEPGEWRVRFYYDDQLSREGYFTFLPSKPEFEVTAFVFTLETPNDDCGTPASQNTFGNNDNNVIAWVDYSNFEGGKSYRFDWYGPAGNLVQTNTGSRPSFSNGCSYTKVSGETLRKHGSGQWRVEFRYDNQKYQTGYFTVE